ncbi:MAG: beta-ketoacyl synthase chain length factor [Sulfurospirillaceae bacterium]|nr:beta-ketoacyl synthase chain length factor [Sulfurospirillaceae bacterium]
MKLNLQILSSAYLLGEQNIQNLHTKELVPKMVIRRRLTRAAKLLIELCDKIGFEDGRIICGSAYGELEVSARILNSIKDGEPISPTDFQNSVFNTAVSYLSILNNNKNEILTVSSGANTAKAVLKTGAIKALDQDELLLVCFETMDIDKIQEVNRCVKYLESAVALRVRLSKEKANITVEKSKTKGVSDSISELLHVAQTAQNIKDPILEVEI